MRDLLILLVHLIATLARLLGPGGLRSVVAESLVGGEFVRIRDSVQSSRRVIWNHPEHRTDSMRQMGG